jgi:hypothetical protein
MGWTCQDVPDAKVEKPLKLHRAKKLYPDGK